MRTTTFVWVVTTRVGWVEEGLDWQTYLPLICTEAGVWGKKPYCLRALVESVLFVKMEAEGSQEVLNEPSELVADEPAAVTEETAGAAE
jgi:hypothetical protein